MSNFKKIVIVLLMMMIMIIASAFSQTKSNVKLVIWGAVPPEYGPQRVIDAFNKEFASQGISAEYERYVNDESGNTKLNMTLTAGETPDVYFSYNISHVEKRVTGNMALDLSSFLNKEGIDPVKAFTYLAELSKFNGKYYTLPTVITNNALLINKDMFDAAGIKIPTAPWTMDEFKAIAKKLTKGTGDKKIYGMFFNSSMDRFYVTDYMIAQNLGGDFRYKPGTNGKVSNFDNPLIIKGLKIMADMMNVDKTAISHADAVTQKLTVEGVFIAGKAAMSVGSWTFRSLKDTSRYPHDFVIAMVPFPCVEKTKDLSQSGGLQDYISVNPKSKNIDAALTFIKWYSTKGVASMAFGGRVPAYTSIDKNFVASEMLTGVEKIFDMASIKSSMLTVYPKYAVPTITNKLNEIRKVFDEEIEAIMYGAKSVEKAMKDAKKRADDILKQQ